MTKTIDYIVRFQTTTADVYNALMNSEKHSAFTQQPAEIENFEGGKFTAFGGALQGKTITLKENEKIVQEWRAGNWPKGAYSEVTYLLSQDGDETILTFHQTGVPEKAHDEVNQGWQQMYWTPMKNYFKKYQSKKLLEELIPRY